MPVEFTEEWFDAHREQARVIGGTLDVSLEHCYDDDGWADPECMQRSQREVELAAFLAKKSEGRWVARTAGDLRLPAGAFKRLAVRKAREPAVEALLKKLRLKMPVDVREAEKAVAVPAPGGCAA